MNASSHLCFRFLVFGQFNKLKRCTLNISRVFKEVVVDLHCPLDFLSPLCVVDLPSGSQICVKYNPILSGKRNSSCINFFVIVGLFVLFLFACFSAIVTKWLYYHYVMACEAF